MVSTAQTWANSVAAQDADTATVEAAAPPPCNVTGLDAIVTRDGGLYLNKEATLSASDALTLGNWIVSTFGG